MQIFGNYHKFHSSDTFNLDILKKRSSGLETDRLIENESYKVSLLLAYKKLLKEKAMHARCDNVKKRLRYEAYQRLKEGWYLIFNTLTVDASNFDLVFSKDSKAWTNYVRLVDRSIGIQIFGSWRNALQARRVGDEFHSYYAVCEQGSTTGRLHIHVLHFCRRLPDRDWETIN